MPIRIKREDGSCTEYRNARLIPAFLMIPEELLKRCGKELYDMLRTRAELLGDRSVIRQVESNLFRECVIDAYAYMAWPHMGLKGRLEDYSGYNPCWKVAHAPSLWIGKLNDLGLLYTFPQWLEATERFPTTPFGFVPYETVDQFLSIAVPSVMQRDGYAAWLNYVQKHPCFEDFDERRYSWQKADFIKKWNHSRTKHPTALSCEVLRIHEIVDGAEAGLLHSNEYSEIEGDIVSALCTSRLQNRSNIVIPKNPCKVKMLIITAFLLSLLFQPPGIYPTLVLLQSCNVENCFRNSRIAF